MKLDPEKVRRARESLGYSIETTGERGDLSPNSVLRAEHGEEIRPSTARRLAKALNKEVADLYPKVQTPSRKSSPETAPEAGFDEVTEAQELAALCGELSEELQRIRETSAEELKTARIAELVEMRSEAETALSRVLNGQNWSHTELSRKALERLRRRRTQRGAEGTAEAG